MNDYENKQYEYEDELYDFDYDDSVAEKRGKALDSYNGFYTMLSAMYGKEF